jgi:hypothetical protein
MPVPSKTAKPWLPPANGRIWGVPIEHFGADLAKPKSMGLVTTAGITKPAKELLDEADIAWIEQFPEAYLGEL